MKTSQLTLIAASLIVAATAIPSAAQPVIAANGIMNAASFTRPIYPNSGIAQGSIFSIFGTGLGPAKAVLVGGFPLPTNLGGTSVAVTVNGTTEQAILFYVGAGQINALLPSQTPVGNGTLTVTYNGQPSATAPIQVVANNFGIFTVASSGTGPGVLTNGQNQANGYTLAANPGEILNLWGTGLGAGSNPDNQPPATGNLGTAPAVYVGGIPVTPSYYGRSGCCSGVDQIQIKIPQNVLGCSVPVAVQTAGGTSNFVSISVAQSGKVCSDTVTGLDGSAYQQLFAKSSASVGFIGLTRTQFSLPSVLQPGTVTKSTTDSGVGGFSKYTFSSQNINGLPFSITNYGACSVFYFSPSGGGNIGVTDPTGSFQFVSLDAGSALTVEGPNGTKTIPQQGQTGGYFAQLGTDTPIPGMNIGPLYLSQGTYTVTGTGGKDVGPFHVSLQVPQALTWTNQDSVSPVNRAAGLTVNWTGGDPNGYVMLAGNSFSGTDLSSLAGGQFICTAKTSDQHLTVPPIVLQALPPSAVIQIGGGLSYPTGNLFLFSFGQPVTFTASGLDLGFASNSSSVDQTVTFQ